MSKLATVSLRLPDEYAVKFALPDGTPADRIGIPLLSLDLTEMSKEQQKELRSTLELFSIWTRPALGKFPIASGVFNDTVGLTVESSDIDTTREALKNALDEAGLAEFVVKPLVEEETPVHYASMATGSEMPASYLIDALEPARPVIFSQLMLSSDDKVRCFDLQNAAPAPSTADEDLGKARTLLASGAGGGGATFRIPLLVPEGVPTGDGRIFEPLSVTTRDLPIPLLWQIKTGNGHDGSVLVGRIDSVERLNNGLGNAVGVFDTGPYGREAERLVRSKMLRGVSADLDQFEAADASDGEDADKVITITKGRTMAATLVPKPAFQECSIELVEDESAENIVDEQEFSELSPDRYDDDAIVACAMIASSIPVTPPREWFNDPKMREPSPLHITDDGRVFGHIALWHVAHVGMPGNTRPPRSSSNYAYFRTGVVRTDDGEDVPVGQLTLAGGHADLAMSARAAVQHYDETNSAVADIAAGEDSFGIWVAGALRPGVTAEQIRTLRASAPSGDWRPINGRLELVAVCQVNVPGFPVARARVASGYVTALVAAGASAVAQLKEQTVSSRLTLLEAKARQQQFQQDSRLTLQALKDRVHTAADEGSEETLFRQYSREVRDEYAKEGLAMKDGSFPIRTKQDLKNAIRAHGRVHDPKKQKEVKRHIIKRARKLDSTTLIPDTWAAEALELAAEEQRLRMQAITAGLRFRRPFDEKKHIRDTQGKFREKLARLHDEAVDVEDGEDAAAALLKAEKAVNEGDMEEAKDLTEQAEDIVKRSQDREDEALRHAEKPGKLVDRFEKGALRRKDAVKETNEETAGAVAEEIAYSKDDEMLKYRYSDLPASLSGMINSLLNEFRDQVGAKEADAYMESLVSYMAGNDLATVQNIQEWIAQITAHLLALKKGEKPAT